MLHIKWRNHDNRYTSQVFVPWYSKKSLLGQDFSSQFVLWTPITQEVYYTVDLLSVLVKDQSIGTYSHSLSLGSLHHSHVLQVLVKLIFRPPSLIVEAVWSYFLAKYLLHFINKSNLNVPFQTLLVFVLDFQIMIQKTIYSQDGVFISLIKKSQCSLQSHLSSQEDLNRS